MDPRMQHPDTVRRLLRDLHTAAEGHRFIQERIDSSTTNEGSRKARTRLYLNRIEAVQKAIDDLNNAQEGILSEALHAEEQAQDSAIEELMMNTTR
jgi:hypothetical protein